MRRSLRLLGLGCAVLAGMAAQAQSEIGSGAEGFREGGREVRRVLLISVDGLHALDLSNYVATHADSTLAALSRHGVTYTNNFSSSPSDSFPGLAALVTGGS